MLFFLYFLNSICLYFFTPKNKDKKNVANETQYKQNKTAIKPCPIKPKQTLQEKLNAYKSF